MDMSFANQALAAEYLGAAARDAREEGLSGAATRSTTRSRGSSSRRWASTIDTLTPEQEQVHGLVVGGDVDDGISQALHHRVGHRGPSRQDRRPDLRRRARRHHADDPHGRVAVETFAITGQIHIAARSRPRPTSTSRSIVRETIAEIGYTQLEHRLRRRHLRRHRLDRRAVARHRAGRRPARSKSRKARRSRRVRADRRRRPRDDVRLRLPRDARTDAAADRPRAQPHADAGRGAQEQQRSKSQG